MKSIPVKLPNVRASIRALVDDEDYESAVRQKWYLLGNGYVFMVTHIPALSGGRQKHVSTLLHRFLLKAQKNDEIDHINGDKLDNRKENLRLCTHRQNCMNRSVQKINKLGKKGVQRRGNRFIAQIRIVSDGVSKMKYLGMFKTVNEASEAFKTAARVLHGDFYRDA